MLSLIFDSKSGFGDDFGHCFTSPFGQTPLRNSVAMETPKEPSEQKLFERVCYTSILQVTKFQLHTLNSFRAIKKKAAGDKFSPLPFQNRVLSY